MIKIFFEEIKKQIKMNQCVLVFLGTLLLVAIFSRSKYHEYDYSPEVYKKYIEQYSGEVTQEKVASIQERLNEIEVLLDEFEEKKKMYFADQITLEEYKECINKYDAAKVEYFAVKHLHDRIKKLNDCDRFETNVINETKWKEFLEDNKYNFILMLGIIVMSIFIFGNEITTGSDRNILCSKYGRSHYCIAQIAVTILLSISISVIAGVIKLQLFLKKDGMADLMNNAVGNIFCTDRFGDVTILQYYYYDLLLKALTWAFYGVVVCMVVLITRQIVVSTAISAVIMFLPSALSNVYMTRWGTLAFSSSNLQHMYTMNVPYSALMILVIVKLLLVSVITTQVWCHGSRD